MLSQLNGTFFVIWDKNIEQLFLARDSLCQALYYSISENDFVFREIKSLFP